MLAAEDYGWYVRGDLKGGQMRDRLSSRERLLAAIGHKEPDHVPLWSLWWPDSQLVSFRSSIERTERLLDLGLDDTLRLEVPHRIPASYIHDLLSELDYVSRTRELAGLSGVVTRVWRDVPANSSYSLIHKEYDTPAGTLQQVVKQTDAWPAGLDIPLLGGIADQNVSCGVEFVVKSPEDLDKLQYLLQQPTDEQLDDFREYARAVKGFANDRGVLVEGGWIEWGDALLWLLGVEGLIFAQVDDPGFVEQLLDMLWDYENRRLNILLDVGVDVIVHRGWYHETDFFTPANYRRFLKPLLKREIDVVHQAGVLYSYIMTKGFAQHYQDFLELGIDILWGVDPVEGQADLSEIKTQIGHQVCMWGGLNSHVTLGMGTEKDIREAVRDAVRILAPGGGFVLFPVDQVSKDIPRESIETMIDEWRKVRDYPIV